MSTKIRIRRGYAFAWSAENPVLALGEIAYDFTNNAFKVGDGSTHWNDLKYADDNLGVGTTLTADTTLSAGGLYFVDTAGITITLPDAANNKSRIVIKNTSNPAGDITIAAPGGQFINDAATITLSSLGACTIVAKDPTHYYTL